MPGLSKKETAKLLAHIEPQGVVVTNVKNGYLLRLPNGETTTVHLTESDHRGPLNLRATLRRAGVDWPTDKHTNVKLQKTTLERGEKVLSRMGYPTSLRSHDFITAAAIDDWKMNNTTVARFLTYRGYEAVGNTTSRRWVLPDEIVEYVEPVPQPPIPIVADVVIPETTVEHREFLDTHDSWVADPDILPETLTIKDMQLMFASLGLKYEIRVWK